MVPPPASRTDQVTEVDCPLVVPVTFALNVSERLGSMAAFFGATDTVMTRGAVTLTATTNAIPARRLLAIRHAPHDLAPRPAADAQRDDQHRGGRQVRPRIIHQPGDLDPRARQLEH